jgi:hypothetical protein
MALEIKNKPYRLSPLARIVVLKLYLAHINDDARDSFSVEEVKGLFPGKMSANLLKSALEFARDGRYGRRSALLSRVGSTKTGLKYKINEDGILTVEQALRQKESDLSYYITHSNEEEALDDVAGVNGIYWTNEEALDAEAWVPLELDRTDPDYKETVEEIEKAAEVIRGDNGFAATHPRERAGILASIEDGLTWFREKLPTRAQMISKIVSPLRWIATTFASSVIGEAAKKAAQRLVDYLATLWG